MKQFPLVGNTLEIEVASVDKDTDSVNFSYLVRDPEGNPLGGMAATEVEGVLSDVIAAYVDKIIPSIKVTE